MHRTERAAARKGVRALGSKIELYYDGSLPVERGSGRVLSFDSVHRGGLLPSLVAIRRALTASLQARNAGALRLRARRS